MKRAYVFKRFSRPHKAVVSRANVILDEYAAEGFVLTLRQLYYQFVARGWLKNNLRSYTRLGGIMGEARLAGLVDWERLEDRTRHLRKLDQFDGPEDALNRLCAWYNVDMWKTQKVRPEVWIEKDALTGVIEGVCEENDVPYFSCRGYTSLSEMWRAAQRINRWAAAGQTPYIIHFGDHDPSGIDMSRDIVDRLATFLSRCDFQRTALNMDQVEQYQPPPNPAKVTDSRYKAYIAKFGEESWELDALRPSVFRSLIEEKLNAVKEPKAWAIARKNKQDVKVQLRELAGDWQALPAYKKKAADLERQVAKLQKDNEALVVKNESLIAKAKRKKGRGSRGLKDQL